MVSHVNSLHLSSSGCHLPEEAEALFELCARCGLIVGHRGCNACKGQASKSKPNQGSMPRFFVERSEQPAASAMRVDVSFAELQSTYIPILPDVPKGLRMKWSKVSPPR